MMQECLLEGRQIQITNVSTLLFPYLLQPTKNTSVEMMYEVRLKELKPSETELLQLKVERLERKIHQVSKSKEFEKNTRIEELELCNRKQEERIN